MKLFYFFDFDRVREEYSKQPLVNYKTIGAKRGWRKRKVSLANKITTKNK